MSAISRKPSPADPRVVRTRAAVVGAAQSLFLERGYAGTTMDDIAERAGITKRTLYNNYADKEALFTQIVTDVIAYADAFARALGAEFDAEMKPAVVRASMHAIGRRLALAVLRREVVALRRLLIGEVRTFPALARRYFDRAPGRVIEALAAGFARLHRRGMLRAPNARLAAEQFAYLVLGEALDRAVLTGTVPSKARAVASARNGVETFLSRHLRSEST